MESDNPGFGIGRDYTLPLNRGNGLLTELTPGFVFTNTIGETGFEGVTSTAALWDVAPSVRGAENPAGQWASHIPAPEVGTRVIVVGPDGRAVADPFEDVLPAPGRPDALRAPSGSIRYAGARPQLDAATEGRPDLAQTRDGSFDLVLQPTSRSRPGLPGETMRVRVKSGATPADLAAQIGSAYLSTPAPRDETLTVRAPARIDRGLLPDLTQALALAADSHQLRVRFYLGDLGPMNICGSPCVA
jgi:hypothetical protein